MCQGIRKVSFPCNQVFSYERTSQLQKSEIVIPAKAGIRYGRFDPIDKRRCRRQDARLCPSPIPSHPPVNPLLSLIVYAKRDAGWQIMNDEQVILSSPCASIVDMVF
jgi:hypothetical protein